MYVTTTDINYSKLSVISNSFNNRGLFLLRKELNGCLSSYTKENFGKLREYFAFPVKGKQKLKVLKYDLLGVKEVVGKLFCRYGGLTFGLFFDILTGRAKYV